MAYVIDRQRALPGGEIVAMMSVRQRKVRARVILKDNSWYQTLTRTVTLMKRAREAVLGGVERTWWTRQ